MTVRPGSRLGGRASGPREALPIGDSGWRTWSADGDSSLHCALPFVEQVPGASPTACECHFCSFTVPMVTTD